MPMLLLVAAGQARADPCEREEIKQLLDSYRNLRHENKPLEALEVSERAWKESQCPTAMAQRGFAEEVLERWVDAEEHLKQALALPHPWTDEQKAAMETELDVIATHLGDLMVTATGPGTDGAELLVAAKRVAVLPITRAVRVAEGATAVELRLLGGGQLARQVTIVAGTLAQVTFEPEPPPKPPQQPSPSDDQPSRRLRPILGGVGLAVGGLLLGGAIAANVIYSQQVNEWNYDCVYKAINRTRAENCPDMQGAMDTTMALSVAGYVTGGALVIASAALLLWPSEEKPRQTAAAWLTCGSGPGQIGIACAGRF